VRGLIESFMRVAYRGDWPAKLWALYPAAQRVTCVRHRLAILPSHAPPLRVGFISDIHIGPTTPPRLLEAAFAQLASEALDVLLLGGDYVFLDATEQKAATLAALVSAVPAARKFAVLGNHDLWTTHACLEAALGRAGVELLDNRSVLLPAPHAAVAVIGLDDPWTGTVDAVRAVQGSEAARAVLVLCHSPDGLPAALAAVSGLPAAPIGLYVCGHTHGGQIAAPWGPIVIPGRVGKEFPHGFHHLPPLYFHVSRGVGATELPMRTYATPEVAVFELLPAPELTPGGPG
jgi:predicted MPP superfamily phosphohydrolase